MVRGPLASAVHIHVFLVQLPGHSLFLLVSVFQQSEQISLLFRHVVLSVSFHS